MQKIRVDTENLNSAVSYFILASKELDELKYRLIQIGNEMADDIDLHMAPEYNAVMEHYAEASKNVNLLGELFKNTLAVIAKTPELYSNAEKRSIQRIKELINKNEKYQSVFLNDKILSEFIAENESGYDHSQEFMDMIEKNLLDLSVANVAARSNDVSDSGKL